VGANGDVEEGGEVAPLLGFIAFKDPGMSGQHETIRECSPLPTRPRPRPRPRLSLTLRLAVLLNSWKPGNFATH